MNNKVILEIAEAFIIQKKANGTYKDPKEKIIDFGFDKYKDCDIKYGEFCPHHTCIYSSLILESGKTVYFKCNREEVGNDKSKDI